MHPKGLHDSNGWCKAIFNDRGSVDIPFGWNISYRDPASPGRVIMEHLSELLSDPRVRRGFDSSRPSFRYHPRRIYTSPQLWLGWYSSEEG